MEMIKILIPAVVHAYALYDIGEKELLKVRIHAWAFLNTGVVKGMILEENGLRILQDQENFCGFIGEQ